MNKIWLIIKREYITRVRKKSFLITTFLAPIGIFIFFAAVVTIMVVARSGEKKVALIDPGQHLKIDSIGPLRDDRVFFKYPEESLDSLKSKLALSEYSLVVSIPEQRFDGKTKVFNIDLYGKDEIGMQIKGSIKELVGERLKKLKMDANGITAQQIKDLETSLQVKSFNISAEDKSSDDSKTYIATALGGGMMFLIYIIIFVYGNMVMRSVMEEKSNRIVEVLISSVKPFQLMLGKIIGVGAVGLTQFLIWAVMVPAVYLLVGLIFSDQLMEISQTTTTSENTDLTAIFAFIDSLKDFDFGYILTMFLFYFLFGYLLYASLFAAIGAIIGDDLGESQSLTLVIAIPVVIAFYIGLAVVENPNSVLAAWSSVFPLFSPVVMPALLVFDPPLYRILLSILFLILGSLFFVWLSARIYRVAIMLYGKKPGFKDYMRWIMKSE